MGKKKSKKVQPNLFSEMNTDLPLFSGTPITVRDSTYQPENIPTQNSLFDRRDFLTPVAAKAKVDLTSGDAGPLFKTKEEPHAQNSNDLLH